MTKSAESDIEHSNIAFLGNSIEHSIGDRASLPPLELQAQYMGILGYSDSLMRLGVWEQSPIITGQCGRGGAANCRLHLSPLVAQYGKQVKVYYLDQECLERQTMIDLTENAQLRCGYTYLSIRYTKILDSIA